MQHLAQRCLGGQTAGQGRHLLNHPGVVAKKSEAKAHGLHFRLPGLQYFVQAGFKLDGFRKKQVLAWGLTRKVVLHHAAIEDALMGRMLVDDHKLPLALAEQVQGKELADKAKPGKLPLAWFNLFSVLQLCPFLLCRGSPGGSLACLLQSKSRLFS